MNVPDNASQSVSVPAMTAMTSAAFMGCVLVLATLLLVSPAKAQSPNAGLTDINNATRESDLDLVTSLQSGLKTVTTRLTAFDASPDKNFGRRVSVDGDTLVASAPADNGSRGAVYVYVRDGTAWTLEQKLIASDGDANDFFGSDVAIQGDLMVVGARTDDSRPTTPLPVSGSAYIFKRTGNSWVESAKLLPPARDDGRLPGNIGFGSAVAINSSIPNENPGAGVITTVVVGAPRDTEDLLPVGVPAVGSIYIYTLASADATVWSEGPRFVADDAESDAVFGTTVAIDSDGIVVGSPGWGLTPDGALGHAYFFQRAGITNTWGAAHLFEASDGENGDTFGTSVAITADGAGGFFVGVGAPLSDDTDIGVNTGAAYVFNGNSNLWSEQKIISSEPGIDAWFGQAMDVSDSLLVVGEPELDIPGIPGAGSVHVFHLGLTQQAMHVGRLIPSSPTKVGVGIRVGISGQTVVAGAPRENDGVISNPGVTYVFDLTVIIFSDSFE
jgi:hypothetical protein